MTVVVNNQIISEIISVFLDLRDLPVCDVMLSYLSALICSVTVLFTVNVDPQLIDSCLNKHPH